LAAILGTASILYLARSAWNQFFAVDETKPEVPGVVYPHVAQGNIGVIPQPMEAEKKTFYYHDPYATTPCEISGAAQCVQGGMLVDRVKNNTARFNLRFPNIGKGMWTTAVNFHGNLWLINKHSIKDDCGIVDIFFDDTQLPVSRNMKNISISKSDWVEIPNTDAMIVELRAVPPSKSLLEYFPLDSVLGGVYKGKYILCSRSGVKTELQVNNLRSGICPVFGYPCYMGVASVPTAVGDCGSLCLTNVGNAQVILGFHATGAPNGELPFTMYHRNS